MATSTTVRAHGGAAARDSRWALVESILGSRSFENSPRLREMFTYICRRAILESAGEVRETEIGIEVFGRPADFDPAHDTIVRVQMSQLRKKIALYFEEEGLHEPVVLEIAKGNYVPVFRPRSALAPEVVMPEPAKPASAPNPWRRAAFALIAVVVVLIAVSGYLARERSRMALREGLHNSPQLRLLWSQLLNPLQPTRIIAADTNLAFLGHLLHRGPVRLADYLDRSYLRGLDSLQPDMREEAEVLLGRQYTGIADAEVAAAIANLAGGTGARVSVLRFQRAAVSLREYGSARQPPVQSVGRDLRGSAQFSDRPRRQPATRYHEPAPAGRRATHLCQQFHNRCAWHQLRSDRFRAQPRPHRQRARGRRTRYGSHRSGRPVVVERRVVRAICQATAPESKRGSALLRSAGANHEDGGRGREHEGDGFP